MSLSTSIRLTSDELERLELAVRCSGKNRNRIVRDAIAEYLDRHEYDMLASEVRRQSLLAARHDRPEDLEFFDPDIWDAIK